MRWSVFYAPTLKEVPSDADIKSQELLTRGGFIRKSAAGVYSYLPLGLRVLQKITQIVREEMDAIGSQELLMPIMQPSEIWKMTGRWEDYGPEMVKFRDRNEREFTLGPTHEEMITTLVKNELKSYRQLPITLYQINTKYRDEIRPRFGLLRGREFIMKDAYSFHTSEGSLDETYGDMYEAYSRICRRMDLEFVAVEADSGAIGGSNSHEFTVFAPNGESDILVCGECGYAASTEKAEYGINYEASDEAEKDLELVETPKVRTVEELAGFLGIDRAKIVKSMMYAGRNGLVMTLIRGDFEINTAKLRAHLGDQTLRMATPDEVFESLGVPIGYLGPVGTNVRIIADFSVEKMRNFVVGGMKKDCHYINVNHTRDFKGFEWSDIRTAVEGDSCPKCGRPLAGKRGIEVGQVFKLGKKYSEKLDATYVDQDGNENAFVMGCYGWGISRTLAAVVEQSHDENGIIWPKAVAPFDAVITVVNATNEEQMKVGKELYSAMKKAGVDVLLDDRELSGGVKFKDADLIGIPLRITIGRALKDGQAELKLRSSKEAEKIGLDYGSIISRVKELLEN